MRNKVTAKAIQEEEIVDVLNFAGSHPLETVFALAILVLLAFLFLRFRKQMLVGSGAMIDMESFRKDIKEEVKIVHERVDRANEKLDQVMRDQTKLQADVSFISGILRGGGKNA